MDMDLRLSNLDNCHLTVEFRVLEKEITPSHLPIDNCKLQNNESPEKIVDILPLFLKAFS